MVTETLQNSADKKNILEIFRKSPGFLCMSEGKLMELADLASIRYFVKGQFIFHEGDASCFFYIVKSGKVKLIKTSATGKSIVCLVTASGDTLNASVLFDCKPHWLSAEAMEAGTVICISKEDYLSFLADNPDIYVRIISIMNEQTHRLTDRLVSLASDNVELRIINVINTLSSKFGSNLFFTLEELAELAATTLYTASRTLKRLKEWNVLSTSRGQIIILDKNKLKVLSGGYYVL